jgi:hypothetical protein
MMQVAAWMVLASCEVESTADDGDGANDGDDGGGDDPVAPDQDVEQCKSSCNQLKFFDCNDSQQHSQCFTACEAATADEIEVFVACVQADICDPSCIDNLIEVAPPPDPPNPSGCVGACESIIADGCYDAPSSICPSACASFSADQQAFIAYCDSRRVGCEFPAECDALFEEETVDVTEGGGGGGDEEDGGGGGEITGGGPGD